MNVSRGRVGGYRSATPQDKCPQHDKQGTAARIGDSGLILTYRGMSATPLSLTSPQQLFSRWAAWDGPAGSGVEGFDHDHRGAVPVQTLDLLKGEEPSR